MAQAGAGERIWFYYAKDQQVGPLKEGELRAAIAEGTVRSDDYVYREGYSDWKQLKDVPELGRGITPPGVTAFRKPNKANEKRNRNRVPICELVVAHNDSHVATGLISNISVTGLFFETRDAVFTLNEEVKLTLKEGKGLGKPMHLRAVVVRQAQDSRFPMGYGLELRGLDEAARLRIAEYVRKHQAS